MPDAQHLLTVPGVGVLTATALVAWVGAIHRFRSGRHFASWLGLTPREHASGASRRLGAITHHGNSYLRLLLIHGARSALRAGAGMDPPDDLRTWAQAVARRHGANVAAVALANKLARLGWRTWRDGRDFTRRAPPDGRRIGSPRATYHHGQGPAPTTRAADTTAVDPVPSVIWRGQLYITQRPLRKQGEESGYAGQAALLK